MRTITDNESGQMAFLMLLTMPVVFIFFALTLDAGVWFVDHRIAQNQADAAALAAVQDLPAVDTTKATEAVNTWLVKNGSGPEELYCLEYSDRFPEAAPDGQFDTVRVCVHRESSAIFSGFSGISFVNVSASATATVGRARIANVKPWAIVPEDPYCSGESQPCYADMDGNPNTGDAQGREFCGYYPPVLNGGKLCPWGMHEDKLYRFKVTDAYTAGNFSPIEACGKGGANVYEDCITGDASSEFYGDGQSVWVEVQTGNLVGPTNNGLEALYNGESFTTNLFVYKNKKEVSLECDVLSTPHPITGIDPDGKDLAESAWVDSPIPGCERRLISVVILDSFPSGSGYVEVLGVATFGIARWDRTPKFGDAMGNDDVGQTCGQSYPVKDGGDGGYNCGQVWGYFMQDAMPPDALLTKLGGSNNVFAPLMTALIE